MSETLFQGIRRRHDEWVAGGSNGQPPARLAFMHSDVMAVVDPFRKLPGTVVVVPREGTPGREHHLSDLSPSQGAQVSLVSREIGRKIVAVTGFRAIRHGEGYGVPDHAHEVIFPAARGEGRLLYEQVERPNEAQLEAELDETLARFGIRGTEAVLLSRRLNMFGDMASILDEPELPLGVEANLQDFVTQQTWSLVG